MKNTNEGSAVNGISKLFPMATQALIGFTGTLLLFSSALPGAEAEARSTTYQLNIPAEDLQAALQAFALASHHKLLYRADLVAGKTSHALMGTFTTEEAVRQLLSGTDLSFEITPASVVLIKTKNEGKSGDLQMDGDSPSSHGSVSAGTEHATSAGDHPGFAQANPGGPAALSGATMNEIIVTAQKREERLQEVPVPVTAIGADVLAGSNQVSIQDYYTRLPGFNVTPIPGAGNTVELTVRGISPTGSNPTVGITVDDVPFGSATSLGGGGTIPDIDPSDLARIELLRGPQGTLYGANSMGGLLKFVTVDPSFDGVSGRVQAGTSSVYNGAALGYGVRGAVNVPLSDTLAIRLSAFTRQDPGYIDNPVLHEDGVNKVDAYGGHLAALWRPSPVFSLKLSALLQNTHADGSSDVDVPTVGVPQTAGLGDLQQNYLRGIGGFDKKIQAYGVTVTAKLGNVDLTAISGYNVNAFHTSNDVSDSYSSYAQSVFGVTGAWTYNNVKTTKFTQEFRLSGPLGPQLDWLLGAFYTYENSKNSVSNYLAENPATGATVGTGWSIPYPTTYQEYAAFTDVTYHVTDRFDIQMGGRESHTKETLAEEFIGPFDPVIFLAPSPIIEPEAQGSASAFTYLVTPRFKVTPDLMVYARLASGYRPGGPNLNIGSAALPRDYKPDKTNNYEVGVKGDFLDRTLSIDSSIYYIDWKDIQLQLVDPTTQLNYFANAGRARSQGIELSVESRPLRGLTVAAWGVWNDATLTQGFPSISTAYGVSGDRLPNSSRFSGRLSLDEEFAVARGTRAFLGAAMSYVGDFLADFSATPERQYFPSYTRTDLHAGVKYDSWTLNLFANNVTDKRAAIGGGFGTFPPFAFTYIQPRTIGASLVRTF
jgi:iron complex outermembrane receptor protein